MEASDVMAARRQLGESGDPEPAWTFFANDVVCGCLGRGAGTDQGAT